MDSTLDSLARLGDITLGVLALIVLVGLALVILIEVLDFLIVDPLRRSHKTDDETPEEVN